VFTEVKPEIVFHLAAEPIVKTCLDNPKDAFDTNLGGSVNIFEAIRRVDGIKSAVIITSDKCYENVEWDYGYREDDRLGGKDPYSASKACVELAFSAYYRSYFSHNKELRISTSRAGNVIGGGDWAKDRIIPDCVRATASKKDLIIRSPHATRPWQLVLEPLSGYLTLGAELYLDRESAKNLNGQAFNFGPSTEVEVTVEGVLSEMKAHWNAISWKVDHADQYAKKEAGVLKLSCDRALRRLSWKPVLSFKETMKFTTEWYMQWLNGANIQQLSNDQIDSYVKLARERNLSWTL
jgi:CDP-glucose 4,6-dehydratase